MRSVGRGSPAARAAAVWYAIDDRLGEGWEGGEEGGGRERRKLFQSKKTSQERSSVSPSGRAHLGNGLTGKGRKPAAVGGKENWEHQLSTSRAAGRVKFPILFGLAM